MAPEQFPVARLLLLIQQMIREQNGGLRRQANDGQQTQRCESYGAVNQATPPILHLPGKREPVNVVSHLKCALELQRSGIGNELTKVNDRITRKGNMVIKYCGKYTCYECITCGILTRRSSLHWQ
ncbi:hypothetical protein HNY73_010843 [Argiope bruennichi]|uniref:Uncharacterized protein n=1 Tax=Argiope bruennichi TaxID=94029 RepID=A0A8T0F758_ARGBR|nr:hypothetical protein HNY73_010843 [Argiope bruennichi]